MKNPLRLACSRASHSAACSHPVTRDPVWVTCVRTTTTLQGRHRQHRTAAVPIADIQKNLRGSRRPPLRSSYSSLAQPLSRLLWPSEQQNVAVLALAQLFDHCSASHQRRPFYSSWHQQHATVEAHEQRKRSETADKGAGAASLCLSLCVSHVLCIAAADFSLAGSKKGKRSHSEFSSGRNR